LVPIQQLIGLLGLPRFSLARLGMAFGLLIVAIGLAITGFIGLVGALRLSLLRWLDPAMASLVVALALLLLAAILCLIARRLARPLPIAKRPAPVPSDAATVQAIAWVQQHPGQSAILAAVLGFCMGASPEAREAVRDLAKSKR
jgi:hypothetical protein